MKRFRLAEYSIAAALLLISGWEWSQLWSNVIEPARAQARRTHCRHDLFLHSGCHPSDVVRLNLDHHVKSVGSCPLCAGSIAPIAYELPDGTSIAESGLPFETLFDARQKLLSYKSNPRYQRIRELTRFE